MINLFLHILCTVFLFLIFRYFRNFNINAFHAVVINYLFCVLIGINLITQKQSDFTVSLNLGWVPFAILTGSLFVPTFYLMGLTVEKVNVSVATVANKMSLIIPVLFSLLYLQRSGDHFSFIKITGIILSVTSIFLTAYKPEKGKDKKTFLTIYPISIFILGGVIDTLINYINFSWLHGEMKTVFPTFLFATAFFSGVIALVIKFILTKKFISWKDLAGGAILGVPNYFSLYFLMQTLSEFNNDGALVFPISNIGVIVIASLLSVLLFRENLSGMNLAGICLSAISIILVFW